MEGYFQPATLRLAMWGRDHPEIAIDRRPNHLYAWKQADGDEYSGELWHAATAAELLAKLQG